MTLLGISGSNASGKDTLGELLAKKYGFMFISVSDMLREELKANGIPLSRENTRYLSTQWRKEFGLSVVVDKALSTYKKQSNKYKGLVIASLRNPAEADRIHELGGKVIWLDAPKKLRFQRLNASNSNRSIDRKIDDDKTYEQFIADEELEMNPSGDEAGLNTAAIKPKVDIIFNNDSNSFDEFNDKADLLIRKLLNE